MDLSLLLINLVHIIFIYLGIIIVHEIGHAFYCIRYDLSYSWTIDKGIVFETDYDNLNDRQVKDLAFSGILFGFIALTIMIISDIKYILLCIPYFFFGCKTDIKIIAYYYDK